MMRILQFSILCCIVGISFAATDVASRVRLLQQQLANHLEIRLNQGLDTLNKLFECQNQNTLELKESSIHSIQQELLQGFESIATESFTHSTNESMDECAAIISGLWMAQADRLLQQWIFTKLNESRWTNVQPCHSTVIASIQQDIQIALDAINQVSGMPNHESGELRKRNAAILVAPVKAVHWLARSIVGGSAYGVSKALSAIRAGLGMLARLEVRAASKRTLLLLNTRMDPVKDAAGHLVGSTIAKSGQVVGDSIGKGVQSALASSNIGSVVAKAFQNVPEIGAFILVLTVVLPATAYLLEITRSSQSDETKPSN
jgi:hypothetical protein